MKTSLLTIALFATLLFWSSCKEKSTEPLSTPEVIERIEMRTRYSNGFQRDTTIVDSETFELRTHSCCSPDENRNFVLDVFWDTTFSVEPTFLQSISNKLNIDSFFNKDSIYFVNIDPQGTQRRGCSADPYHFEVVLTTNQRSKTLVLFCDDREEKYDFDDALWILVDEWFRLREALNVYE